MGLHEGLRALCTARAAGWHTCYGAEMARVQLPRWTTGLFAMKTRPPELTCHATRAVSDLRKDPVGCVMCRVTWRGTPVLAFST